MRAAPALGAALLLAALAAPALAQTPPPPPTKDYVMTAAQSDQYEILAAHVATTESRDPRVRAFAEQMIHDHTGTSQRLRRATASSGMPPPPPGMSSDQARMLGSLQSLTGPDFDRAYARQQVLAHAQALTVQQLYAGGGADPTLRRTAEATVPLIRHHAEEAQQLAANLGAR